MSKKFYHAKRKRAIAALSLALSATFALGLLSACGGETAETPEEDDTQTSTATDTQFLKNGNFEYYDERDTDLKDKRTFISTPTNWSFSSGSPSSNTRSGLIETDKDEWAQIAKPGSYNFKTYTKPDSTTEITTFESIEEAVAHWTDDNVTVYDRLKFLDLYKTEISNLDSNSEARKTLEQYNYTIDFEDVDDLSKVFADGIGLHAGVEDGQTALLMIHNQRTSDGVMGTAQYYTSSTTITLEAGTAAEVSVWVRTDKLYHYYSETNPEDKAEIERYGGAYIGVINSLGGNTLDEMQIKNIRTLGKWENYKIYIRANDYASTTFRIKLGLGQGTSSDNRYEAVDGYAFFDDVVAKKISSAAYEEATGSLAKTVQCDSTSLKEDKIFDLDRDEGIKDARTYALDLLAEDKYTALSVSGAEIGLTKEQRPNATDYSYIKDNRKDGKEGEKTETPAADDEASIVEATTYGNLASLTTNKYFKPIYENDFKDKFPFGDNSTNVLLLLSTNGAAYTAEVKDNAFSLDEDQSMLISFYVKTSKMRSGISGAGITLVDGTNKTEISPFDTTTVSPVDIDTTDETLTDIYKGWVHCFFFVTNNTEGTKTFSLKFTYGPTTVTGTTETSYCEGYAAFADFKYMSLSKSQYSYASTGNYAKKVELTEYAQDTSKFTDAEASSDITQNLATPASFYEGLAGSKVFDRNSEIENKRPDGVYAGLLNSDYAANYLDHAATEDGYGWLKTLNASNYTKETASEWWNGLFGDTNNPAYPNRQPLVLVNAGTEATSSYGYYSSTLKTTISSGSSQRISMRVKVQRNTTAYIYLLDSSDVIKTQYKQLITPELPGYTYWYDEDGNVVKSDPTEKDFKKKTDTLFYLEKNGLYTRADKQDDNYYANLHNYTVEENAENKEFNLVTKDGQIAFYGKDENGTRVYYAYRNSVNGAYEYSQVVHDFTEASGIDMSAYRRYTAPASMDSYAAVIKVVGTEETEKNWTTVNFYVRAGGEEKTYRLELWAGARDSAEKEFPAGGYVFFDAYKSVSASNYETLRDEAVETLIDKGNALEGDEEKVDAAHGLYYTFTFYDSANFLRHDRTLDEVDLGSKWGSYDQTTKEEQLVWLSYQDDGAESKMPEISLFIDFTAAETSVTPDSLDTDTDTDDTTDAETPAEPTNIWLVLSSSLLAVVTLFAIGAVVFRAIRKRAKKNGPKPPKPKKVRPVPAEPEAEKPAKQPTHEDPYDE